LKKDADSKKTCLHNLIYTLLFGIDLNFVILKTGNKTKFGFVRHIPKSVKKLKTISFIIVGLFLGFLVIRFLINFPFDAECDGHGKANGHDVTYGYQGDPKFEGDVKDCLWQGRVTCTFASGIMDICNYDKGQKHGEDIYYDKSGQVFKTEIYDHGKITSFTYFDFTDHTRYNYHDTMLYCNTESGLHGIELNNKLEFSGNDDPFVLMHEDKLILRGSRDLFVINKKMEVQLNMRDTLMKYIPSAYTIKTDNSGNKFDFLWHRDIVNDTLHIKVFYDGDESQSNQKTWEHNYSLR
jgi:hypothetical protein